MESGIWQGVGEGGRGENRMLVSRTVLFGFPLPFLPLSVKPKIQGNGPKTHYMEHTGDESKQKIQ